MRVLEGPRGSAGCRLHHQVQSDPVDLAMCGCVGVPHLIVFQIFVSHSLLFPSLHRTSDEGCGVDHMTSAGVAPGCIVVSMARQRGLQVVLARSPEDEGGVALAEGGGCAQLLPGGRWASQPMEPECPQSLTCDGSFAGQSRRTMSTSAVQPNFPMTPNNFTRKRAREIARLVEACMVPLEYEVSCLQVVPLGHQTPQDGVQHPPCVAPSSSHYLLLVGHHGPGVAVLLLEVCHRSLPQDAGAAAPIRTAGGGPVGIPSGSGSGRSVESAEAIDIDDDAPPPAPPTAPPAACTWRYLIGGPRPPAPSKSLPAATTEVGCLPTECGEDMTHTMEWVPESVVCLNPQAIQLFSFTQGPHRVTVAQSSSSKCAGSKYYDGAMESTKLPDQIRWLVGHRQGLVALHQWRCSKGTLQERWGISGLKSSGGSPPGEAPGLPPQGPGDDISGAGSWQVLWHIQLGGGLPVSLSPFGASNCWGSSMVRAVGPSAVDTGEAAALACAGGRLFILLVSPSSPRVKATLVDLGGVTAAHSLLVALPPTHPGSSSQRGKHLIDVISDPSPAYLNGVLAPSGGGGGVAQVAHHVPAGMGREHILAIHGNGDWQIVALGSQQLRAEDRSKDRITEGGPISAGAQPCLHHLGTAWMAGVSNLLGPSWVSSAVGVNGSEGWQMDHVIAHVQSSYLAFNAHLDFTDEHPNNQAPLEAPRSTSSALSARGADRDSHCSWSELVTAAMGKPLGSRGWWGQKNPMVQRIEDCLPPQHPHDSLTIITRYCMGLLDPVSGELYAPLNSGRTPAHIPQNFLSPTCDRPPACLPRLSPQ